MANGNINEFKSFSTNMFAFNEENRNKLDSDWNQSGLLKFPKIKPQLKEERKIQRDIYKDIMEKFETRRAQETEHKINRYDVEINLKRMLYKNEKYLGLCRNRHKVPNMFGNKLLGKLKNLEEMTGISDGMLNPCRRFEQYTKRHEDRCLKEIFEPHVKRNRNSKFNRIDENVNDLNEDDKRASSNNNGSRLVKSQSLKVNSNTKQFVSNSVSDFHINASKQRTSTMIESLKLSDSRLNTESITKKPLASLKPKRHQISLESVKNKILLPPIQKQKSETYDDDDFESEDEEIKEIMNENG